MGTRTWNKDRATKRIDAKIDELPLKDIQTSLSLSELIQQTIEQRMKLAVDSIGFSGGQNGHDPGDKGRRNLRMFMAPANKISSGKCKMAGMLHVGEGEIFPERVFNFPGSAPREGFRYCCAIHSAVGCRVSYGSKMISLDLA
jgi:hypothetical protein